MRVLAALPLAAALTACTLVTDLSKLGPRDGFAGSDASTNCGDIKSDPNHCGACNHSCLGGACSGGSCQPKIIDTLSATPLGLAVDAVSLFWTTPTTGVVTRWALDGAAAPTVFAQGQQTPTYIATVDNLAVWVTSQSTTKGTVTTCPSAASCPAPKDLESGDPNPMGLYATNGTVYWTMDVFVASCTAIGCSAPTAVAFGPSATGPVVADATDVYFTTTKGLGRCPVAGCPAAVPIVDPSPAIVALAIDATSVYWPNSASNSILKCAKPACAGGPTTVALGQTQVQGIAVDASGVYWTSAADGTVKRAPLAGGAITTLIDAQSGPAAIVLDALSVYWLNTKGGGAVLRLAKP